MTRAASRKQVRQTSRHPGPSLAKRFARSELQLPKDVIADFCRRHHIRRLAIFGSALRDDFRPESDLDILVEFETGHVPGLAFFGMQSELSAVLRRPVDLNTPQFLSPYFRDQVRKEALVVYEQA